MFDSIDVYFDSGRVLEVSKSGRLRTSTDSGLKSGRRGCGFYFWQQSIEQASGNSRSIRISPASRISLCVREWMDVIEDKDTRGERNQINEILHGRDYGLFLVKKFPYRFGEKFSSGSGRRSPGF